MSVAFRRDCDEEHLEPRFELPVPPGPNLVTARGYALLQSRNDALQAEILAAATDERRTELQRDLRYWRKRLATARIAPPFSGETVAIGACVTIEQGGETRVMHIVGHDEADPAAGLLPFSAPLARCLMGAGAGDEVEAPGRQELITIVSVEASPDAI